MSVDLSILAQNVAKIQQLAPRAKILAMVKGNAYGHGMVEVSKFILERTPVRRLGVASLGEGIEIAERVPEVGADPAIDIIAFSDNELLDKEWRIEYQRRPYIKPVVSTLPQLDELLTAPDLAGLPVFLKINTGMNRLGIRPDDITDGLIDKLRARGGVQHLMQHFSVSGEPATPGSTTLVQYQRFRDFKQKLLSRGVNVAETSVANSGAICQGVGVDETYVRPGLMLYGPRPGIGVDGQPLWREGRMVAALRTKVIHCFTAKKGEHIGYGYNALPRDGFIVMVPVGYADGMIRGLPGKRRVQINGCWGTVFGSVNMDMCAILMDEPTDTVHDPSLLIKAEDSVDMWGAENDNGWFEEVAEQHGTITYNVLTNVSIRIPRVYRGW